LAALGGGDAEIHASGPAPLSADEAVAFEGANHLHGLKWEAAPKMALYAGLGGNLTAQAPVDPT